MLTKTNHPKLGQAVIVRGLECRIVRIRPLGTIDVQAKDGRCFRLSGLELEVTK